MSSEPIEPPPPLSPAPHLPINGLLELESDRKSLQFSGKQTGRRVKTGQNIHDISTFDAQVKEGCILQFIRSCLGAFFHSFNRSLVMCN